jgi:hypothetical protein
MVRVDRVAATSGSRPMVVGRSASTQAWALIAGWSRGAGGHRGFPSVVTDLVGRDRAWGVAAADRGEDAWGLEPMTSAGCVGAGTSCAGPVRLDRAQREPRERSGGAPDELAPDVRAGDRLVDMQTFVTHLRYQLPHCDLLFRAASSSRHASSCALRAAGVPQLRRQPSQSTPGSADGAAGGADAGDVEVGTPVR